MITADQLARLSRWIDESPPNAGRDPEATTWGRLAKVAEESGEVIAAYIGATGQNPRKGVTHNGADVAKELLDVAVTALAAYEHLTGNRGASMDAFMLHVAELVARAGLTVDQVDVIAEPDRRRAEHMNRTLRRAEGGDET